MTPKQQAYLVSPAEKERILQNQCLDHPVLPEDVSAMALFLASDDSRMCTAQHFVVDGGLS